MDLATSGSPVVVAMKHYGDRFKIMEHCTYPLTASTCVRKIITDLAVFDVDPVNGLTLLERYSGVSIEEIAKMTSCQFRVSPNLAIFE